MVGKRNAFDHILVDTLGVAAERDLLRAPITVALASRARHRTERRWPGWRSLSLVGLNAGGPPEGFTARA